MNILKNKVWTCSGCNCQNPESRATCFNCGTLKVLLVTKEPVLDFGPDYSGDGHQEEIQMQRDHGLDPIE